MITQLVTPKENGKISISIESTELIAGREYELKLEPKVKPDNLLTLIPKSNSFFKTAEEVDRYVASLRDE